MSQDIAALAKRFFDLVEAGDVEGLRAIYAADAVIWHNTDQAGQSVDENLGTLASFVRLIPERRYDDRRLSVFEGGFVQRHLLRGVRADGAKVSLPACIVCAVEDGRITRLDEYMDSAQVAAFIGR